MDLPASQYLEAVWWKGVILDTRPALPSSGCVTLDESLCL